MKFERSPKIVFGYDLTLPNNPNNEKFFLDYLNFSSKNAVKEFKKDVLQTENKKLKRLNLDLESMKTIQENFKEKNFKDNRIIQNIEIMVKILNERAKIIKRNINFVENLTLPNVELWLVDKPEKTLVNEKFYTVSKYTLPIILTLIIHLFYVLIKISKEDNKS